MQTKIYSSIGYQQKKKDYVQLMQTVRLLYHKRRSTMQQEHLYRNKDTFKTFKSLEQLDDQHAVLPRHIKEHYKS